MMGSSSVCAAGVTVNTDTVCQTTWDTRKFRPTSKQATAEVAITAEARMKTIDASLSRQTASAVQNHATCRAAVAPVSFLELDCCTPVADSAR